MSQTITVPPEAAGKKLSQWLIDQGIALPAACGGRGVCGKCRVKVLQGQFLLPTGEILLPDENGNILSCRAFCTGEAAVIELESSCGGGLVDFVPSKNETVKSSGWAIALDIGTTTVCAALIDRSEGKVIETFSCLNPQQVYGADVITRIAACGEGKLKDLHQLIIKSTNEAIDKFARRYPGYKPDHLFVAGNTTMLHLFCGISPESMGVYPFTPQFTRRVEYSGQALGLKIQSVTVLPSASAFIGSDVVCGMLISNMTAQEGASLLMDIGTNGEMVLCSQGTNKILTTASTAAGPALEGANISCGVGGISGAVSSVTLGEDGRLFFKTIDDAEPIGICGSGLIDLIGAMLALEVLDETGALEEDVFGFTGTHLNREGKIIHTFDAPVFILTQKDIREFQLAKSAIRAGIEALVYENGLDFSGLDKVYIAGGLGYYINIESAVNVGMLPAQFKEKTVLLGNSSLGGAVSAATSKTSMDRLDFLAESCILFELNRSAKFNEAFIEDMFFPERE